MAARRDARLLTFGEHIHPSLRNQKTEPFHPALPIRDTRIFSGGHALVCSRMHVFVVCVDPAGLLPGLAHHCPQAGDSEPATPGLRWPHGLLVAGERLPRGSQPGRRAGLQEPRHRKGRSFDRSATQTHHPPKPDSTWHDFAPR